MNYKVVDAEYKPHIIRDGGGIVVTHSGALLIKNMEHNNIIAAFNSEDWISVTEDKEIK